MDEIGLGGADFRDDLRNPAPILRDVAQRVTHPNATFAQVSPEAVLDDGLAAPHYQEDVKRLGLGLGRRTAGAGNERRCHQDHGAGTHTALHKLTGGRYLGIAPHGLPCRRVTVSTHAATARSWCRMPSNAKAMVQAMTSAPTSSIASA